MEVWGRPAVADAALGGDAFTGTGLLRPFYLLHARSPFDALATLACSGQALAPPVKARGFGMTHGSA